MPTLLIDTLTQTLRDEDAAVERLDALLRAQLAALRADDLATLEATAAEADDAAHALGEVRRRRERQQRLAARTLGCGDDAPIEVIAEATDNEDTTAADALRQARADLVARAADARANSDALAFALDHAARLSRSMLDAWQHLQQPATGVYTAVGKQAAVAAAPSRLDRAV